MGALRPLRAKLGLLRASWWPKSAKSGPLRAELGHLRANLETDGKFVDSGQGYVGTSQGWVGASEDQFWVSHPRCSLRGLGRGLRAESGPSRDL